MADTQPKRPRDQHEEPISCEVEITKRHKNSYTQILSILDDSTEDELHEPPTQDLTDFFTALQQELSSELSIQSTETVKEDETNEDRDKEMVIRHLLEASDDELGLPNRVVGGEDDKVPAGKDGGGVPVAFCDGLWDIEDDAANYYSLWQSELII